MHPFILRPSHRDGKTAVVVLRHIVETEPENDTYESVPKETSADNATEPANTVNSVVLPEGIELFKFEDFDDLNSSLTELSNGWFAIDLGENIWQIFDENGTPLGIIFLPSDINDIKDFDIELIKSNLVPLRNTMLTT